MWIRIKTHNKIRYRDNQLIIRDNLKELDKLAGEIKSDLLESSEKMEELQEELIKFYGG